MHRHGTIYCSCNAASADVPGMLFLGDRVRGIRIGVCLYGCASTSGYSRSHDLDCVRHDDCYLVRHWVNGRISNTTGAGVDAALDRLLYAECTSERTRRKHRWLPGRINRLSIHCKAPQTTVVACCCRSCKLVGSFSHDDFIRVHCKHVGWRCLPADGDMPVDWCCDLVAVQAD